MLELDARGDFSFTFRFPGGGTHSNPPPSPPTAPLVTSTSTTLASAQTTSPSPASSDPPDASRPAISHISSTLGPNTTPTAAPWPSSVPQSAPPDGSKPVSGTDSAITSDGRQIIGLAVGLIVILLMLLGGALLQWRSRKRQRAAAQSQSQEDYTELSGRNSHDRYRAETVGILPAVMTPGVSPISAGVDAQPPAQSGQCILDAEGSSGGELSEKRPSSPRASSWMQPTDTAGASGNAQVECASPAWDPQCANSNAALGPLAASSASITSSPPSFTTEPPSATPPVPSFNHHVDSGLRFYPTSDLLGSAHMQGHAIDLPPAYTED